MLKLIIYCHKLFARLSLLGLLFYLILPNKVHAVGWEKYPGNPVFDINAGNWDGTQVANPAILHIGNEYFNWYQGNQSRWNIGYASSPNGINNWSRSNKAVLSPGTFDGWEVDLGDPSVLLINGQYKIWYSSSTSNWTSGLDRFRLSYAESINPTDWTRTNWILKGTPSKWDEGGIGRGISVIKIKDVYRMWYAGTNTNDLTINPYWRIGYATSLDGLTWTKEYQGNPIIIDGESSNSNISYPTILYSGGLYHMWYGIGTGDIPTQIGYAYSIDGTRWVKPAEYNPVLTIEPGMFDGSLIMPHTVLLEDNVLKMWYSGFGADRHWRIGYATASASILPTPDPETIPTAPPLPTPSPTSTPTPTPTPTATPTPTPSPTPTPTPNPPSKQVIVIPGMTASWNADALINCKSDNYVGGWTLLNQAHQIYDPLIHALNKDGWVSKLYTYDWRKRVPDNEADLKTYINSQIAAGEKLNIVGHSMGGLLGRAYIEQEKNNSMAEKLMTVGSPHKGSVVSYPTWSAGEIPKGDPAWKFMLTLLEKRCAVKTQNDRLAVQQYFPGIRNLLPTFDYLMNNQTGNYIPVADLNATNDWLTGATFASPFFGTTVGTLSGTGQSTELAYRVGVRNKQDERLGNWSDGKPAKTITTAEGDGTVLVSSSALNGADNRTISASHNALISSQDGINQILDFLSSSNLNLTMQSLMLNNKTKPPESPIISSALYVIGYPADFWIMDPKGKITKDTDGLISFTNPKRGSYTAFIAPKQKDSLIIVIQVLPDGRVLYKEYSDKNRLPKIHILNFDDREAKEDILK
ncbi:MAG: hypothetical protein NT149_03445 [Candidatus Gottesmanbacteria bacterium]|nr:hypothetical protein [Candidatus Gottesmanbacteria bacterium]